ncbi:putative tellurite resistance protein B-like protein [Hymenobacter sp. UYAg731]
MDTQLLQNYSEQEKTAYLSAIASLATADRQASGAEGQFLQALAQQAGLSGGATQQVLAAAQDANNESIQQNLDILKNSDLRFSLVTDLISFARADGSYANDEEAMISKMSQYLGINAEQKQTLETVVDQAATIPHDPQDPAKTGFLNSIGDKLSNVGIPKGALMAGLLGVVAPMVISKVIGGGNNQSQSGYGDQSNSGGLLSGGMGGLLGGVAHSGMGSLLGGLLGSGMLGGLLGGGNSNATADMPQQGSAIGSGGLGSMMSILGGLGGQPNSQPASAGGAGLGGLLSGGLGSMLGGLFGGR